MARRQIVYAKNISEHPQEVRHYLLKVQTAIAVAPGGLVEVVNSRFMLPPGAICQIPIGVWELIPGIGKKQWSKEVTREDFLAAMRGTEWVPAVAAQDAPAEEPAAQDAPAEKPSATPKAKPRKAKVTHGDLATG